MRKKNRFSFLILFGAITLSTTCLGQTNNPYKHPCPDAAVFNMTGFTGLLPFYSKTYKEINLIGKNINVGDNNWAYTKIKNENVPALKNTGRGIDEKYPFVTSYFYFDKSKNSLLGLRIFLILWSCKYHL